MNDKVDFAGPQWIERARSILESLVAEHGEEGSSFSVCETFTDAPRHVAPGGTAAWHFYIEGRTVRVGAGAVDDTDVRILADYAATLPAARLIYTPEVLAERAARPPDPGGPSITGDMSKAPGYLVELHNRLAKITA